MDHKAKEVNRDKQDNVESQDNKEFKDLEARVVHQVLQVLLDLPVQLGLLVNQALTVQLEPQDLLAERVNLEDRASVVLLDQRVQLVPEVSLVNLGNLDQEVRSVQPAIKENVALRVLEVNRDLKVIPGGLVFLGLSEEMA